MSNNLHLFMGESHYQVHEALQYRKSEFIKKYGAESVHVFRHDEVDKDVLQSSLFAGGFFSEKSLTILYGLPRDSTGTNKITAAEAEPLESLLIDSRDTIPSENILILVSYKPDKRTKSRKFFSSHATIKECKPKKGKDLTLFVLEKCQISDGETNISLVDNSQAAFIVSRVGNNMYNLHYECDKIVHYALHHKLSAVGSETIEKLLYAQAEHDSFKILDSMFQDPKKAITLIEQAQANMQNEFEFMGMLYRGLKLILGMIDLDTQGIKGSKEIAKILKIHPFAVAKQYSKIGLYKENQEAIQSMYQQIMNLDYQIKTGQYPAEGFWVKVKSLIWEFGK